MEEEDSNGIVATVAEPLEGATRRAMATPATTMQALAGTYEGRSTPFPLALAISISIYILQG